MTLSAAKEFGADDPKTFVERLISAPLTQEQIEILAGHLTIGETYFWREPSVFEALEERILPELIRLRGTGKKRLRIWSAGCSTGEEPYSIAIALHRALPSQIGWNITILATDINTLSLRKAAKGLYGKWSFRNAPSWLTTQFFRPEKDGKLAIIPEIKKMVTFEYLNLAEDRYPSSMSGTNAMDIVFCRNVLMYFSEKRARQIALRLRRSLVEGGWLVVSSNELSQSLYRGFVNVHFPEAIVYRKPSAQRLPETAASAKRTVPPRELHVMSPPPLEAPKPRSAPLAALEKAAEIDQHAIADSVRALADRGNLEDALELCGKAIIGDKLAGELRYLEATILLELNREEEAVRSLKRTLYLDPDFVLAHFTLGNLAIRRGDAQTGRRCFENALSLLAARGDEDLLSESEGLTAGRFREIIHATLQLGASA